MKDWDLAAAKRLEDQGRVRGVPALVRPPLVIVTARPVVERRERAPNTWEAAYARAVLEPRRDAVGIVAAIMASAEAHRGPTPDATQFLWKAAATLRFADREITKETTT